MYRFSGRIVASALVGEDETLFGDVAMARNRTLDIVVIKQNGKAVIVIRCPLGRDERPIINLDRCAELGLNGEVDCFLEPRQWYPIDGQAGFRAKKRI